MGELKGMILAPRWGKGCSSKQVGSLGANEALWTPVDGSAGTDVLGG